MCCLIFYIVLCVVVTITIFLPVLSVDILLKATGDAPIMKKRRWTVEPNKKIGGVVQFMKKYLKYDASESLVSISLHH